MPYDTSSTGDGNSAAVAPAPSGGVVTAASTPKFPDLVTPSYRFVRPLGTQLVMQDGRKFRYSAAGGTTLVVGNLLQTAAILTTDQDMTPLTGTLPTGFTGGATVGEKAITFTHGAATVVINRFAEGYVFVTITPGFSDTYKIANHIALASAAAGDQVNLWPGHGIRRALTSSSRVSLQAHPNFAVIQFASGGTTGAPIGVAVTAITGASGSGNSGWIQTRGPVAVLVSGTAIAGEGAAAGVAAGAVGPVNGTYGTGLAQPLVGVFLAVEATTQAGPVYLTIDG